MLINKTTWYIFPNLFKIESTVFNAPTALVLINRIIIIIIITINDLLFLIFYYILTIIIIGEREKIIDKKIMIKLFDNPLKNRKEHESNPRFTKQTFFQDLVNPFLSLIFIII